LVGLASQEGRAWDLGEGPGLFACLGVADTQHTNHDFGSAGCANGVNRLSTDLEL
jgi:hypothetical protein